MFNLSLKAEGLKAMTEKLKMTAKLGSTVANAELNSVPREDRLDIKETGATNREILNHLKGQGRDFMTLDKAEAEQLAQAYVDKFEQVWAKQNPREAKNPARAAHAVDMAGFRDAMKAYMKIVYDRIKSGKGHGSFEGKLTPQHEAFKIRKIGHAYPIGKLTEQLLENINPSGSTVGRIKVNKR